MRSGVPLVVTLLLAPACGGAARSLEDDGLVGSPCDHDPGGDEQNYFGTANQSECAGEACVYAEERVIPPDPCNSDTDCNPVGADAIYACQIPDGEITGSCRLSHSWVLERSMCAPACESDADCTADIAAETTCATGFSCAALFVEGDLCCRSMCLCNDDLPDTSEMDAVCAYPEGACA